MKSLKLYILFVLSIAVSSLSSQSERDDLWDAIKNSYRDSVEQVLPLTTQYIDELEFPKDSLLYIEAIRYRGKANRAIGNYVQAIDAFKETYQYAKVHQDSILMAESANQLASMNIFMGNMAVGQTYLMEVVDIYKQIGSLSDIAGANNGLAIFYSDIGQIDKAIEYYNLSLQQSTEANDTLGQANVHANLGILYLDEGNYEKAEYHILQQGYLDTLLGTQWGLGFHYDFMGSLRRKQGKLQEALRWKKQSLKTRQALASHYNIAESRAGLSRLYLDMKSPAKAIDNALKILDHKDEHQSLSQEMTAYAYLSEAYEMQGDYQKALSFHQQYMTISDSIYSRDQLEQIALKDALYEKEKRDNEIALLNADKTQSQSRIKARNWIIIICLVAIASILALLFALYKLFKKVTLQKDQLTSALSDKDMLIREIHHRVKNNLQLISSLLTLQGRSLDNKTAQEAIKEGKSRVRSMALIHQNLYNKKELRGISIQSYLEKLTEELFYTYNINGDQIKLELDIASCELDIDTMVPLGLIINELVTNSLKYAFPDGKEGSILVQLKEQEDSFRLVVEDDGIGYSVGDQARSGSFGTTLIKALSKQLKGEINTNSSHEGTTTTIIFNDLKKVFQ